MKNWEREVWGEKRLVGGGVLPQILFRHDALSRTKPWAHRKASQMRWGGPEPDSRRGSWGQERKQRGQEKK